MQLIPLTPVGVVLEAVPVGALQIPALTTGHGEILRRLCQALVPVFTRLLPLLPVGQIVVQWTQTAARVCGRQTKKISLQIMRYCIAG